MGMGKVSGKICRLKKDEVKRYDFAKKVKRPRALRPLTYFISKIFLKGRVRTYDFQKMEGLKPPYLILANHSSMLDFALAVDAMWPVSMTYVAALDSIFDFTEFLMRRVGIIAKRKFIKDLNLLKNLKYSVTKIPSCPTMMYPEAKYSLEGCTWQNSWTSRWSRWPCTAVISAVRSGERRFPPNPRLPSKCARS